MVEGVGLGVEVVCVCVYVCVYVTYEKITSICQSATQNDDKKMLCITRLSTGDVGLKNWIPD